MVKSLRAALVGLVLVVAGCAGPGTVKDAARQVGEFHDRYNAGQYKAVWAGTSKDMREATSEQRFLALLTTVQQRLGKVLSAKQVGWASNFTNGDSFVTIRMQTRFERGSGEEVFIYRKDGDDLGLAGYHIDWDLTPPAASPAPTASGHLT